MDRLSALSATFLQAEDVDPSASLAIGSVAVFEGPVPPYEDFVQLIEGRLPWIPRYRQRLRTVPFSLAAPVWVDDPHFDVRWHVRHTAVPPPGGPEEIGRLLSRVMSRRMDRSRPLWEYWFCEGLAEGRWAVLSKLHHSLVDGVSGTDLYQLVLDPTPVSRRPPAEPWHPTPGPSSLSLAVDGVVELVRSPVRAGQAVAHVATTPLRLLRTASSAAVGLCTLAGAVRPVHPSSLTGHLDGSRCYTSTDVTLEDIRAVRRAHDVTVNDVALALVSGGLRRMLVARGELPDAHAVRSLVPVSTRRPGQESVPDNQVSLLLPYLPVDLEDPLERLRAVHDRVRSLRGRHEPEAGEAIESFADWAAFGPVAWAIRIGLRLPQLQIATVTTNVPGPASTLYSLGREAVAMLPYVPIADRVRIGVAMFSYRGILTFGITGDYGTEKDLAELTAGIDASIRELLETVSGPEGEVTGTSAPSLG